MDRRTFLMTTGSMFGTSILTQALPRGMAPRTAASPSMSWAQVKQLFDTDPRFVHMAGFFLASHPRPVRQAIENIRRAIDQNPSVYVDENIGRYETQIRAEAGRYLGVDPNTIAMTDSTTMGLGTIYTSLKLEAGDEILTTEHDHWSTRQSLAYVSQRTGALIKRIALYEDGAFASEQEMVSRIMAAISPKTKIVAITWVHSSTGVKLPVGAIGDAIQARNRKLSEKDSALLCVDAVHGFGVEDFTIPDLKCDFFVAGCHKWILGPRGTGLIWGSPRGWDMVRPTIPTFDPMWRDPAHGLPMAALMTPGGFHSFEHRWALGEAFRLHQSIGKARVARRIHNLNMHCKAELAKMPHVKLHTPISDQLSAGMICFDVDRIKQTEVVSCLLEKQIIASITPYQVSYARLAPSLLNSFDDVERTVRAVRDLGKANKPCPAAPKRQLVQARTPIV